MIQLATGFHFDDLPMGTRFRSRSRTVTETDLVNFVNFSWLNEELFTDHSNRSRMAISGRVVPGAMIYSMAEGLVIPTTPQGTGLAFLSMGFDIKGPTYVNDTIHVEIEVTEIKLQSRKPAAKKTADEPTPVEA